MCRHGVREPHLRFRACGWALGRRGTEQKENTPHIEILSNNEIRRERLRRQHEDLAELAAVSK
jgi:hypothetical protein